MVTLCRAVAFCVNIQSKLPLATLKLLIKVANNAVKVYIKANVPRYQRLYDLLRQKSSTFIDGNLRSFRWRWMSTRVSFMYDKQATLCFQRRKNLRWIGWGRYFIRFGCREAIKMLFVRDLKCKTKNFIQWWIENVDVSIRFRAMAFFKKA